MTSSWLILLFLPLAIPSCGGQPGSNAGDGAPRVSALDCLIRTDALMQGLIGCVNSESSLYLLDLPSFREIYDSADSVVVEVSQCLRSESLSEDAKRVLCHIAYGVCDMNKYITLLESVLDGFERGGVSREILRLVAFPEPSWGCFLAADYSHPRVQTALTRILNSPLSTAGLRDPATFVLSGDFLRRWREDVGSGAQEILPRPIVPLR